LPAPTINLQHYGVPAGQRSGPDDDDDDDDDDNDNEGGNNDAKGKNAKNQQPPTPPPVVEEPYVEEDASKTVIRIVKALFEYDAQEQSEMSFTQGDRIAVYS
jgi:hypothetical protein